MNLHHPSFLYYTSVQLRAFSAHKIERCSTAADSIRQRAQAAQAQRHQADFALIAVSGRTSGSVAESPLPHKMVCQRCQARRAACSACYREHLPGASASPPRTRFLIFLRSGQDFLCLPLQRTIHFVKEPPSTGAAPPISARRLKRSAFDKVIKSAAKESSARLPNLPKTEKGGGLNRTDFQGLTPELLRLFIQKNLVHGREMEQTRPADGGAPCSGGGRAGGQADAPQRAKVHVMEISGRSCRSKICRGSGHQNSCPHHGAPDAVLLLFPEMLTSD